MYFLIPHVGNILDCRRHHRYHRFLPLPILMASRTLGPNLDYPEVSLSLMQGHGGLPATVIMLLLLYPLRAFCRFPFQVRMRNVSEILNVFSCQGAIEAVPHQAVLCHRPADIHRRLPVNVHDIF
ncbi:MAG: hypothetical protein PWR27_2099 [Petroclostridium sp.]|jgi:hypothetical protein|nr:hypothetical protein [Thermoanaerobacter sp.]MDK2811390.1 hypothetical protein [Petroclostridium sp.]